MHCVCLICRRQFRQPGWLRRHYQSEHPGYLEQLEHERARKRRYAETEDSQSDEERLDGNLPRADYTTEFYTDREPVINNILEPPPTIVTLHGDIQRTSNQDPNAKPVVDEAFEPDHAFQTAPEPTRVVKFSEAGLPVDYVPTPDELYLEGYNSLSAHLDENRSSFHPFETKQDHNLAEWLIKHDISQAAINDLLKGDHPLLESTKTSLRSPHVLKDMVRQMDKGMAASWYSQKLVGKSWNENHVEEGIEFYFRDPLEVVRYLLRQVHYSESPVYAPEKRYENGHQQFSEMHTGKWWWKEQEKLPPGSTLCPIIAMSDSTHLTNFAGDKKSWPIYITLGNFSGAQRAKPTTQTVALLGLFPVRYKNSNLSGVSEQQQRKFNSEVMHDVIRQIFACWFRDTQSPAQDYIHSDVSDTFYSLCSDSQYRLFYPRLAGWLADFPEQMALHNLASNSCPWCEVSEKELGVYPSRFPPRNHVTYRKIFLQPTTSTAGAKGAPDLARHFVKTLPNAFWSLPCDPVDLPKPDLLHTIQLGLLKHLMEWNHDLLQRHRRLPLFNRLWKAVPRYVDLPPNKKTYQEITQWTGREYKNMSRFLVGVLANSLRGGRGAQRPVFKQAVLCTRALIEFYLYCQYPVHDRVSLDSMRASLDCFRANCSVFSNARAHKKDREAARAEQQRLIRLREAEIKKAKSTAAKSRIRSSHNRDIAIKVRELRVQNANFNLPKIHQINHFADSVELFGSMAQYSTNLTELSHKVLIKSAYNSTNKTGNFITQMLEHNVRREVFAVRELNRSHRHLLRNPESSGNVHLTSVVRPAAMLGSSRSSYGPNAIKTFYDFMQRIDDRDLSSRLQDVTAAYFARFGHSEEDLLWCPTAVYHKLTVFTAKYGKPEWLQQTLRATGETHWHNSGKPRHDWVWWRAAPNARFRQPLLRSAAPRKLPWGALRGKLPVKLISMFKISLPTKGMTNRIADIQCAFVETTHVIKSGALEDTTAMPRVCLAPIEKRFRIIPISAIDCAAHLIPMDPDDSLNTEWLVNTHIDIETWNEVTDDASNWVQFGEDDEESGEVEDFLDDCSVASESDGEHK
jgi:hypothetical protein